MIAFKEIYIIYEAKIDIVITLTAVDQQNWVIKDDKCCLIRDIRTGHCSSRYYQDTYLFAEMKVPTLIPHDENKTCMKLHNKLIYILDVE